MTTRNPNLDHPSTRQLPPVNQPIAPLFTDGRAWWTGVPPLHGVCPGVDASGKIHSLPPLCLDSISRQQVIDYFNNTWTLTEVLFSGLLTQEALYRPPYHGLRHPLIFYYAHPAVLYLNKLRVAGLLPHGINDYFEKIFETGVDEMSWDDMSKNEAQWPDFLEVHAYRRTVYEMLMALILSHPDLADGHGPLLADRPLWALFMSFEHERIHLETSSVLIRELPATWVAKPAAWPDEFPSVVGRSRGISPVDTDYPANSFVPVGAGDVRIGKPDQAPYFGWDNEYGERCVAVKATQMSRFLISNGEYYRFVKEGGYSTPEYWSEAGRKWRAFRNVKFPTFWVPVGPAGAHEYQLRTTFCVDAMPWDAPAVVNYYEAIAYCNWLTLKQGQPCRLLTEAEHHRLRQVAQCSELGQARGNFGLSYGAEAPVDAFVQGDFSDVFGNVWHWCEDHLYPLPGFKPHAYYEDFSTPCFDGRHQMILGGSFISTGDESTPWARFQFRPHFFQHAGFRVATGPADTAVYITESGASEASLPSVKVERSFAASRSAEDEVLRLIRSFHESMSTYSPGVEASYVPDVLSGRYSTQTAPPEQPQNPEEVVRSLLQDFQLYSEKPGHPRYFGYLAGSAEPWSAVAQYGAALLNPYAAHARLSPVAHALEQQVLGWFARAFGFSDAAGGFLTSGSSSALMSALYLARKSRPEDRALLEKGRIYISGQAHHALKKASAWCGFAPECVVEIGGSDQLFNIAALETRITEDLRQGLIPFFLLGTAGTTNTGSIEPLSALSNVARKFKLWFHVDGAYGAPFALTGWGKQALAGMALADSLNFDFHKSLSMPYAMGALLVAQRTVLQVLPEKTGSYMPAASFMDDVPLDSADVSSELSRDFRGLRIWLPIQMLGFSYFKQQLDTKREQSLWLFERLRALPGLTVVPPELTVIAFHCGDQTAKLLETIHRSSKVLLSSCRLGEQLHIRLCVLSYQTSLNELALCEQEIRKALEEIAHDA